VDGGVAVPVVPGEQAPAPLPITQLAGLGALAVLVGTAAAVGAARRRRAEDADPALAGVPLVISGLGKRYPGDITAVEDLSFRVEQGQVLGLLGPNGAGKTTVLRMLMGLIRPSAGEIRVFGHRVAAGSPVLSRIGSFVEGSGFLPHLSGAANLRLYWAATGRPARAARFDEALEIAGLGTAVHRRVGAYSQGMRQRLAIAQAMLGLPDLLVLDEPTNGLDPPQIHAMREVLRGYAAGGRTVLVSSHLLAEVARVATRVGVLHHGRLVDEFAPHALAARVRPRLEVGARDTARAARVLREAGFSASATVGGLIVEDSRAVNSPELVATALVRAGEPPTRLVVTEEDLEAHFLRLVTSAAADGWEVTGGR